MGIIDRTRRWLVKCFDRGTGGERRRDAEQSRPPVPSGVGVAAGTVAPAAASQWSEGAYTVGGATLRYRLYQPRRAAPGARPLLVMLHGCTQDALDFAQGTRMNEAAGDIGWLVLYPEQSTRENQYRCWNWFRGGHQRRDRGEPALIAGLTRQIVAAHGADPCRVYVAGLSAGGAMAVILAETYPDVYAAVGVHSGLPYAAARGAMAALAVMRHGASAPAPEPRWRNSPAAGRAKPVPAIVFHGDEDTDVHPRNGELVAARFAGQWQTPASNPQPAPSRGTVSGGRSYVREVLTSSDGRPVLEYWRVGGSGHAWSGGSPLGSYTDPAGPDASAEMLRFFSAHSLTPSLQP